MTPSMSIKNPLRVPMLMMRLLREWTHALPYALRVDSLDRSAPRVAGVDRRLRNAPSPQWGRRRAAAVRQHGRARHGNSLHTNRATQRLCQFSQQRARLCSNRRKTPPPADAEIGKEFIDARGHYCRRSSAPAHLLGNRVQPTKKC
jgi:hypothetical protein